MLVFILFVFWYVAYIDDYVTARNPKWTLATDAVERNVEYGAAHWPSRVCLVTIYFTLLWIGLPLP